LRHGFPGCLKDKDEKQRQSGDTVRKGCVLKKRVALTADEKAEIIRGEAVVYPQPTLVPGYRIDTLTFELCEKQEWKCFWCGEQMSNVAGSPRFRTKDHIVPLSNHGVTKPANIRAVCQACNQIRGQFTSMTQYARYTKGVEEQLRQCQTALARHKVTMAGRCYYCKWRFHIKEWLHKLRAR
jgi:hypothetical protein